MFNRSWGDSQRSNGRWGSYDSGYGSSYGSGYYSGHGSGYYSGHGSGGQQRRMMRRNAKEQERQLNYQMKLQTQSEIHRMRQEAKQRDILQRERDRLQGVSDTGTEESRNIRKKFNLKRFGTGLFGFVDRFVNGSSNKEILKVSKLEYDDALVEDVRQYNVAKCGVLSNE